MSLSLTIRRADGGDADARIGFAPARAPPPETRAVSRRRMHPSAPSAIATTRRVVVPSPSPPEPSSPERKPPPPETETSARPNPRAGSSDASGDDANPSSHRANVDARAPEGTRAYAVAAPSRRKSASLDPANAANATAPERRADPAVLARSSGGFAFTTRCTCGCDPEAGFCFCFFDAARRRPSPCGARGVLPASPPLATSRCARSSPPRARRSRASL